MQRFRAGPPVTWAWFGHTLFLQKFLLLPAPVLLFDQLPTCLFFLFTHTLFLSFLSDTNTNYIKCICSSPSTVFTHTKTHWIHSDWYLASSRLSSDSASSCCLRIRASSALRCCLRRNAALFLASSSSAFWSSCIQKWKMFWRHWF